MITLLRLQNFRSYSDSTFEFSEGVTVVHGNNGAGKTNILEALYYLAKGSSFRMADNGLLRHGSTWARIDGNYGAVSRTVKFEIDQSSVGVKKQFILDHGQVLTRLHESRKLPIVLFEPNHLKIITGSPELRRGFLDEFIAQYDHGHRALLKSYQRSLQQRNSLLKQKPSMLMDYLFVWNLRLSELGAKIIAARLQALEEINRLLPSTYASIAAKNDALEIQYVSKIPTESYASTLLRHLELTLQKDIALGYTTRGVHRDDLEVLINKKNSLHVASRGEVRSIVLALKLIELQLKYDIQPILLLDDVFSELDSTRQKFLAESTRDVQVIITSTDMPRVRAFGRVSEISI